jgi:Zn-dependent protease with chaperone function
MLLTAEGIGLVGLAVVLAGPAPAALARATWPGRSPRAALVLWQAVGLSGGLAILGAGLTLAVSGLHRSWLGGLGALPAAGAGLARPGLAAPALGLDPLGWAGTALTAVTGTWLVAVLAVSTVRLTLARRAHRQRLDLLADELALDELLAASRGGPEVVLARQGPGRVGGTAQVAGAALTRGGAAGAALTRGGTADAALTRVRLVDHPLAAAYCLPGVRPRIVVSRGVIDALSHAELCAVVSHEKAHARGRHDLVIQPFRAWRQTFPFLAAGRAALAAVELLVELAADNAARRRGHREPLASALRALAAATAGGEAAGGAEQAGGARQAGGGQLRERERRLAAAPRPLPRLAAGAVCAAAVALVCVPPAILIVS